MADYIRLTVDDSGVRRLFARIQREAPKLAADAITHAAFSGRKAIQASMGQVFDRPTQYTLNSMTVQKATPNRLEAKIWFKDLEAKSAATNRRHYLVTETFGGQRPLKQFEARLEKVGILPPGHYAVPGPGAPLDANGNMLKSEITKIMSWFAGFDEVGYSANKTAAGRERAKRGTRTRRGTAYFVARRTDLRTKHLQPGIYRKTRFAFGWAIKPVILFVPKSSYRKRLPFYEVGREAAVRTLRDDIARAWKERIK
jgi:hypothetical protein